MKIHHLNCVQIESPFGPAIGHCLLLEEDKNLTLIDAGIGLEETIEPEKRLGKELVEITGFKLDEKLTAVRQIEKLNFDPKNVKDIICSHLDPDHIGGLVDFPNATIHVSKEEYESFQKGHTRYLPQQLQHKPTMRLYEDNDHEWLGLPARKLNLDIGTELFLIPLFGHTLGHCGVALKQHDLWNFYIGDAYYFRAEITDKNHPVDQLATINAMDNELRKESLDKIRTIIDNYGDKMEYFGYHDPCEFEEKIPLGNIA